ncbi:hypothetical protein EDB83DRAFT_2315698 [Lactarius deliciosus]|nr:hypothetical protein EDB83DRAFT_2315698 [Lactarius deliciosus]
MENGSGKLTVSLDGRFGESEGSEWEERSTFVGTSRGGDIRPNIVSRVASSGLGEGGVMGTFRESLSSPGGVRMVKSIGKGRGETATGARPGLDEVEQTGVTPSGFGKVGVDTLSCWSGTRLSTIAKGADECEALGNAVNEGE